MTKPAGDGRWAEVVAFIRKQYPGEDPVPLHAPRFRGREKEYLCACVDTTFVSSVGAFVDRFEQMCAEFTGAAHAVAAVNGTCALHVALQLAGVQRGDEVITQPLTFVATANAISYLGARPVFVDVDKHTLGLSPDSLQAFLEEHGRRTDDGCLNTSTGRIIRACLPMHTFGHPSRIDEIKRLCDTYGIVLVEDAAESLGSSYRGRHTGTTGLCGVLSFNGNKTITTGGGGMILTNDPDLAQRAKHLTTTGKVPHRWEYVHDTIAYNYRLTNIAAALGCAQMEQLESFLQDKRRLAETYRDFFAERGIRFVWEPPEARSNFWLDAVVLDTPQEREEFLAYTNARGVQTRPVWRLMNELVMYRDAQHTDLATARYLAERIVNIPSGVR